MSKVFRPISGYMGNNPEELKPDGIPSVGHSLHSAPMDHVHPSDPNKLEAGDLPTALAGILPTALAGRVKAVQVSLVGGDWEADGDNFKQTIAWETIEIPFKLYEVFAVVPDINTLPLVVTHEVIFSGYDETGASFGAKTAAGSQIGVWVFYAD